MPLPTTDEDVLIAGIEAALVPLQATLSAILVQVTLLRERGDQGALPPAAVLINEFITSSDLDGGRGLGASIYGRDFIIDPDDPLFPPTLQSVHNHPAFPDPAPPPLGWQAYLDQFN